MMRFIRTAKVAPGKFGEVGPLARKMCSIIESKTGVPVDDFVQHGGHFGTVSWQSDHADFGAYESFIETLTTDPEYVAKVLESGEAGDFLAGETRDVLWRKR